MEPQILSPLLLLLLLFIWDKEENEIECDLIVSKPHSNVYCLFFNAPHFANVSDMPQFFSPKAV